MQTIKITDLLRLYKIIMKKVNTFRVLAYFENEKIIGCFDLKSDLSCGYQHTSRKILSIENHGEI